MEHGLQPIGAIVKQHITEVGLALVKKQEAAAAAGSEGGAAEPTAAAKAAAASASDMSAYVQELLDCHGRYSELVKGCFGQNAIFQKASAGEAAAALSPIGD